MRFLFSSGRFAAKVFRISKNESMRWWDNNIALTCLPTLNIIGEVLNSLKQS